MCVYVCVGVRKGGGGEVSLLTREPQRFLLWCHIAQTLIVCFSDAPGRVGDEEREQNYIHLLLPPPPPQLPRLFLVFLHTDRGGRRSLLLGPAVAFPPLGPDGGVPSSEAPSAPKFTPGVNFKSCAAINRSD